MLVGILGAECIPGCGAMQVSVTHGFLQALECVGLAPQGD